MIQPSSKFFAIEIDEIDGCCLTVAFINFHSEYVKKSYFDDNK